MSLKELTLQLAYKRELTLELNKSPEKRNKKYIETLKQLILC